MVIVQLEQVFTSTKPRNWFQKHEIRTSLHQ